MISIRTKLILFISLLIIFIDVFSCLFFSIHLKRREKEELKKLGISTAMLFIHDSEVEHALVSTQPAFLEAPVRRMLSLDLEEEIGYWRISNIREVLVEEKAQWLNIDMKEIPTRRDFQNLDTPFTNCMITCSGKEFYDFSVPIFEKQAFSEEVLAAQIFSEDTANQWNAYRILGFIQIGVSTHKMNKKIHKIILYGIFPMGLGVVLAGMCITFFFTRYIVSPLQRLTSVTLDIAKGNFIRMVDIRSRDEIGQLSTSFNQMTQSLEKSYADLNQEIAEHKQTAELLRYRVKIEELIASISANFINLAPEEVDGGINNALKIIGEFVGVDRSYIFMYGDNEKRKMDSTHEWCAEGIEPQLENLKGIPVDRFPWGMEKLRRLETIRVPRVSDMPACATAEKELQQSRAVRSFVLVPMVYGGSLIGFLGFDSVRVEKTWVDQDIMLLKVVGEIFVNALEHKRKEEILRKAYDSLEIRVKERTQELLKINKLFEEEIAGHKKARAELKKYEILISEMTDLSYICDVQGNILFVNKIFEKLTGHKREEFLGKSFSPLFDEENLKKAIDAYIKTLKGESPQYELHFKDTGVFCEYKNLPLRDETGNIIGVIGIARDITERKRMVDALRQAKDYAENLIETANVMIIGFDVTGNIQVFNETAEKISGYKKNEITGKNYFEAFVSKERYSDIWQTFNDWLITGKVQKSNESAIHAKSGKKRYISWQNSEILDQGKVVGIISFGNDITELKERQSLVERLLIMSFVKDVGVAITQGATLCEILQQCAEAVVYNLNAAFTRIWTCNEEENILELQASAGMYTHINGPHSRIQIGKFKIGLIAQERKPHLTNDLINDTRVSDRDWVKREGMVAFAGYPLIVGDRLVGVIAMFSSKPLGDYINRALASAADIIAVGIERKQTEQAQLANLHYFESMNEISSVLNQSMDVSVSLQSLMDTLLSIFNCDRAGIGYPCDPTASSLIIQFEADRPGIPSLVSLIQQESPIIPEAGELMQITLDAKEPVTFDCTKPMPKSKTRFGYERLSIQSMMGVAIYPKLGKPWVMGLHQCSYARKWTKDEQRLFKDISHKVADALTNMLLYRDLCTNEGKYRTLLSNLPQKIFHKDKNSIYVSCNENYANDLHIKLDEIVGKTDYDFYPKEFADKYRADDKRVMESGKTEDIEEKYIRDGRELIVHTIKTPIKDEKGDIVGVLGVFWDITEKVAAQMEAVRTGHLASLGELAAGVAHEINNPITGVINCAQILSDRGNEGSKEKDVANRIIKEGKRIANIVNRLLSYARLSDVKEPVHVREIVSETISLTETQLRKEGVMIKMDIPQKLPVINVYPQQMQQVFLNIISNARYALNQKYPETHDNKILEILGEEMTMNNCPYIKVTFYDRGTGIPASIIKKVMDLFFTNKPRGKGTGLGLSISHGIISEHGGQLEIDSVEGEFTKVTIILPAVRQR